MISPLMALLPREGRKIVRLKNLMNRRRHPRQ